MSSKFFALALLLPSLAYAASQPCLDGSCTFHINNGTANATTGSLFLNGTTSAISDLTEDAGWTVIGCDAQDNSHAVRAICTGSNSTCNHLYNNGANNTIVRLPAGCGKGPFARVVNEYEHENQTVPDHVRNILTRRDGEPASLVRGIILDTNWTAIDPSHHGPVSLHILATTGHDANATVNAALAARDIQGRSLFDKLKQIAGDVTSDAEKFAHKLENVTETTVHKALRADVEERSLWDDITSAAKSVANSVTSAANTVANDVTSAAKTVANAVEQPFNDNKSNSTSFSGSVTKTVASGSVPCAGNAYNPSFTVDYSFDAVAKASGTLTYGLALAGQLVPPNFSQFSMDVGIDADISSSVSWSALGGLSTSTGWLTLFETGLPGLTVPDVLVIGPMFQLNVEATQQVQSNAQLSVDLAYTISGAKLSIPSGSSSGTLTPKDTSVNFSAAPGTVSSGSVTAHIIPTVLLGLDAFGGKAATSVNVNLDASATLDLSLQKTNADSYLGNVEIDAGLSVNAGATATFFSFLNTYKQYTIASHSWKLWSKSYNGPARRDHARELPAEKRVALPDGMSCAWPGVTTVKNLLISKVPVASIRQLV